MQTLDKIVKTVLMQRGYSIHWYFPFLVYARDCWREICFDDAKDAGIVNTVSITLDTYNEACLPPDFCDIINVGYGVGQSTRSLISDSKLNTLVNTDADGNRIRYTDAGSNTNNPRDNYLIGYEGYLPYYSYDYWGAYSGKWFGYNGAYSDTYTIIKSRNVIHLNESLSSTLSWSMQYLGDGSCINSGTLVDPYAIAAIQAYIQWQLKENNRNYGEGERERLHMIYKRERAILRGRKSDLTLAGIKRAIDAGYSLIPKV